jgi:hypothetical protein
MSVGFADAITLPRKPDELFYIVRMAILVVASLLFLDSFNGLIGSFFKSGGPHGAILAALPMFLATVVALPFARQSYSEFIPILRIALRSSSIGLLVYLVIEPPIITLAAPAFARDALYIETGYYFALALAALSVISPAFNIPVAVYILSTRHLTEPISGIHTSSLDIRYMLDMAVYLSVFAIGHVRFSPKFAPLLDLRGSQENIAFIAFGLHLGNYFWSGVAKAVVGLHFWSWPFENQTQNIIPYALDKGTLPIGHFPWIVQYTYDIAQFLAIPLNLAIMGFQLFAIICVLRLSWLKVATIFYDMFHIGIFYMSGLFFWPWIWNNFTILAAANTLRTGITKQAKAGCILTIILGNPIFGLYESARLGWFDVADARQLYFEAVTDKERAMVPASFFLTNSYGVSLGYVDSAAHPGHYPFTPWNAARDYNRQVTSGTCPPPVPPNLPGQETMDERAVRLERVGLFVRAHHAKMLARQRTYPKFSYYFMVHHQPSNPYLFEKFNALDLDDVRAYDLVVESACYQIANGHVIKKLVGRTIERFDVR